MSKILVELQDVMGDDRSVASAAWTSSYDKNRRDVKMDDPDSVARVINMLVEGSIPHGVPFESVVFRFWIRHPIFTDRQHCTHRIASHSGLSGRYRTVPDDWYSMPQDCKDIMNRFTDMSDICTTEPLGEKWAAEYDALCERDNEWYRGKLDTLKALEKSGKVTNAEYKRLREILRGVLPQAAMTERTSIFNLRSFANYVRQRTDGHAQPEIQSVAGQMLAQVRECGCCPASLNALESIGWCV